MRGIVGLLSMAVLAASVSTSSAATLALTDTTGDPAAVSIAPGDSFSFKAILMLDPLATNPSEAASGIGFNLHSSQSSIFTITARVVDPANPFTDLTTTDVQMLANTPGLNPQNGTDLGGTTPAATNVPAGTYPLYTFTMATSAAAPQGTYQITVVESYITNEDFDSISVVSGTYAVTLVPEPISLGTMGVVLGGLILRPRRRVTEL